jgi:hypothetical protein
MRPNSCFYVRFIDNDLQHFVSYSQKLDTSDLTFEDSFSNSLSDDKNSNQLNGNSRTKLVSKRSVSDDSDKSKQIQSDEGWFSRVKRRLSNFFTGSEEKVEEKRELPVKPKEEKIDDDLETLEDLKLSTARRRRRYDEDDDEDDEDNEIASGDHLLTTPDPDPITPLAPVKDDKYCKNKSIV